jgi:CheY-like chemotaxis protein
MLDVHDIGASSSDRLGRLAEWRIAPEWRKLGDRHRFARMSNDAVMSMSAGLLPTIAVIDDDQASAFALSLLLQDWGYEVFVGSDANGILSALDGRPLRAIVTDFHLRAGNGVDAGLVIRKHQASACPVVVISGSRGPEPRSLTRRHAFPLLLKPFDPERLRELLQRLTG